jgi:TRAP transporter TAXI family solute receptor
MPRFNSETFALLSRRELAGIVILVAGLLAAVFWFVAQIVQPSPPGRIVMASGVEGGLYHRYALRYKAILARDGVKLEERMTNGADENLRLLEDPKSGVDVAFTQAGIAKSPAADDLVMLAGLYYEPLWIFSHGMAKVTQINQLQGKRIATGIDESGTRAFLEPLLRANGLTPANTTLVPLGGDDALRGLLAGELDAAAFVGGVQSPTILAALRNPELALMNLDRADAYARLFPYITKLTLPPGTIDLALDEPKAEVTLIGTEAMLVAREGMHPALINLLMDAAHEIHSGQSYFEAAGEFPRTNRVDLPVSVDADRHQHFGPTFLHRYLPFWLASLVERLIIVVVPLVVVLVPVFSYLPQFLSWRVRSRIYRWYGELKLLERDVGARKGTLPIEQWLADLDRIEVAVEAIKTPASFASQAYTLREHIGLVRRAVLAKAGGAATVA